MSWKGLEKPSPGKLIRSSWGAGVVEALDDLYYGGAVTYDGYVQKDLLPVEDLKLKLGDPNLKFKEVNAGYGYFTYQLTVQGKVVLKDGDPISIYDIFEDARIKITQAIDYSYSYAVLSDVDSKLQTILQQLDVKISVLRDKLDYIYDRLNKDIPVDILESERTISGLVENITADGYEYVLYPSTGKRISTRSWLLHSDSSAGRITLKFPSSNKLIGVIFPSKQGFLVNNTCHINGYENEPIILEWSDLSVNSNIFYQITFKEKD